MNEPCFFCNKPTSSHDIVGHKICHVCYVNMSDEDKQRLMEIELEHKLEVVDAAREILLLSFAKQKKV